MSTRCHVRVIEVGTGDREPIQLYHHTDGYPGSMVEIFRDAFVLAKKALMDRIHGNKKYLDSMMWELGRAGKVAGFLCCADPGTMEPENSLEMHGDIEYLYNVYAVNEHGGSIAENPHWEIEILVPMPNIHYASRMKDPLDGKSFWDEPTIEKMNVLMSRRPLAQAVVWAKGHYYGEPNAVTKQRASEAEREARKR